MMTHDELMAKLDDFDIALSNGFGDAKVIIGSVKAIRAVVELHKPVLHSEYEYICEGCNLVYPCETIQAIEKELQ